MGKEKRSVVVFLVQSALLWSCTPILYSFMPVYLDQAGFRESQIGFLLALGPVMSIVLQPYIGVLADRSRYKNTWLILLNAGTMVSILLFLIGSSLLYVTLVSFVLASFQAALISLSETITLEGLDRIQKPYGPVRLAGTAGYAAVSVIVGFFMEKDIRFLFHITAALALFSIISSWSLPKVEGHQSKTSPIPPSGLFRDKMLVLLLLFATIAHMGITFYQNFFPIYFASIGGTSDVLGILYFISAISETPFLVYADRILKRTGIQKALALSMGVIFIRFLLMYVIKAPAPMYPVMLLNGLTFIIFTFSLAVYINNTVRPELRATGQTIHGMCMGAGRILGSVLGGCFIEWIGLMDTILCFALLSLVSIAVFLAFSAVIKKKHIPA